MTTFTYGDFIFQIINSKTCRIGNGENYANGPKQGTAYQGPAIIPEIAIDDSTKRKYIVVETSIYCFRGCTSLKEVVLPQTLKLINTDSFWGTAITNIVIPKSVETLNNHAFSSLSSLTTLIFEVGSKLKTIDNFAFKSTDSLKRVVLPPELKSIGYTLFHSSTSSSIVLIYCGKNVLSESTALTSPSAVKAYVTNLYPKNTKIGGVTPEIVNDNTCTPYYNYRPFPQCTKQRSYSHTKNMLLFTYLIIAYYK